jgi:hypothetical protein
MSQDNCFIDPVIKGKLVRFGAAKQVGKIIGWKVAGSDEAFALTLFLTYGDGNITEKLASQCTFVNPLAIVEPEVGR